ncbi:hypothetical protein SUGI_0865120 [Cryptomeria japonica]|nr:hypothetical protein SUGI_0865120 [Cryptomeria japonica]
MRCTLFSKSEKKQEQKFYFNLFNLFSFLSYRKSFQRMLQGALALAEGERELELLVLQFLYEENLGDTAHMLEQESGCFFNMKYFGDQVLAGNLDDADSYLLGFTRIEDNKFSRKIFFQLRKHKYLEALDSKNWQHQHWKNQRSNLGTQIPQEVLLVPIAMPAPLQHDAPPSISNSLSLTVYPNPPISHSAAAAGAVNYLPENEGFLTCSRRSLANSTGINYQCVNSENARKRSRIVTVDENNFDNKQAADVKERIQDEDVNKIEDRKLADVSNSVPCRSFKLPDPKSMGKIVQLLYKNSGSDVLALASNTAHKIWKWTCNNKCSIFARTAR